MKPIFCVCPPLFLRIPPLFLRIPPPPQQQMCVCSLILLKSPHFQSNMFERSRNWVLRYTARNVHHLSTMFIFSVNAAYHKQQKALDLGEGILTLNLSGEVQLTSLFRLVRNRPLTCIKQFFYNFKTIESKPVRTRKSLVLITPPFRIKVSAPRLHRWLKKFYL